MNEKDRLMDELIQLRKKIVELEKKDRLFKETEESGKIGGWQFDPSTLKQTWSEETFRILEIDLAQGTPEVPKGLEFIDPGFRPEAEKAVQRAMEYGEPYNQEWMVTTYKGNKKWVNAVGNPKIENGKVVSVSGSFQDITSEKIAEENSLKKNEELNKVQEITHTGSWHLDIATNEVTWSKELYKMYGFDPNLPVPPYTEHMKLFTPESWEILSTSLAKTSEKGIPYELELRTVRGDNTNGWMWVCGEAIYDENKKIIGLWGAAKDISESKNIEIALKTAKEKAEESEEKFSTIFNMSLSMICVADINTATFKFLNPAFKRVLGYEEKELLSKPFLDFIHPDDVRSTIDVIEKKLKAGIPQINFENRYKRKDGSYCYLAWNSFPFPEKGITYAIAHDITEQKKTELELIKYKDHLEELVKDRTAELEKKNESLKILNSVFVGRELRMKELKDKINALEGKE